MTSAIAQLAENVSVPFEQARAMPPAVYTSGDFLKRELSDVFSQDWFCVGRASALGKRGDYLTLELAGQPIIVIRDRDGTIQALSNVCLHRMSTLLDGRGNTSSIVCPYHAWTYNLDGSLRGAPAMTQNEGFCKQSYKLPKVRCEEWLGWLFVTLNPDAPTAASQLSRVEELVGDYDMANYTETFFETHVWDTNWKVLAENFMESYHLPVCHADTVGGLSKLEEMICPPGEAAFNYHTILKDDQLKIALAHPNNKRLSGERRRTTYLLAILPQPADYAHARILLVPYAPAPRRRPSQNWLWRRHVAGLGGRRRCAEQLSRSQNAARCGECGRQRLHGKGLSRPLLAGR